MIDIISDFRREMQKTENETVNKALAQLLEREPTTADYKKCKRIIIAGMPGKWYLMYDNIKMGWIEEIIKLEERIFTYSCKFCPDNTDPIEDYIDQSMNELYSLSKMSPIVSPVQIIK